MGSLKAEGIVLRHANYRDHDRMLQLLTPKYGLVDALCRGCRRPKSPLLPASQCFCQGGYLFFQNRDRYTVTACDLLNIYYPLRQDPYRLTCASYMAGLCRAAAQQGEPAPELYALLLRGLDRLCTAVTEASLLAATSAFLLQYADATGYRPRLGHCANCERTIPLREAETQDPVSGIGAFSSKPPADAVSGFHERSPWWDVQAGGLVCGTCAGKGAMRLTGAQVTWMRAVLARGYEAPAHPLPTDSADGPPASEKELFTALKRYVEARLEATLKVSKLLP
ncbi:MAG: DNA repair protein RecO [Clostridia bacterium]|nr:DNA repair protein RecO [Clostridia bacterium]